MNRKSWLLLAKEILLKIASKKTGKPKQKIERKLSIGFRIYNVGERVVRGLFRR
ncbi:MAG: hypothetical protein FWC83_02180 [Alphaproteobacteria bacterium]|nr:hypothetical protein [Alphaproteobacteria bacterium]